MTNDNVTKLVQPGAFEDSLTEILRSGARALLAQAVEAEVAEFLGKHSDLKTEDGHQRLVRHDHSRSSADPGPGLALADGDELMLFPAISGG